MCRPRRFSLTVSGPSADTVAAPTTSRASRTSVISPAPFGVGIKDRAEIFALLPGRYSRRSRPASDLQCRQRRSAASSTVTRGSTRGGVATTSAICYVGAKVNLLSQYHQKPGGGRRPRHPQAAHGQDDEVGVSTGKTDFLVDFIASKETARGIELSGLCRLRVPRPAGWLRCARQGRSGGAVASAFPSRSRAAGRVRAERRHPVAG